MKVLRVLYIGLVLIAGFPVVLAWAICAFGWCMYIAIREKDSPVSMVVDMFSEPIKFAIYVYSNWVKYGNKFSKYPGMGSTF